ncbi:RNA binding protein [Pseudovirgaria hyperparasitica]|uniref:RNA binding protein n=1 Tax=Pseudovirgaria hyperparasitica TaxID=470096 RepID=A0A6A6WMV8_9PEZI|nr:RNA binding protein [Pseudovirgaria hyperparasitica]KAF2763561.1 RNA binding protein [Pseudovirgaria hyperparasitica]
MAPTSRSEQPINLNYIPQLGSQPRSGTSTGSTSPTDPSIGSSTRFQMSSGSNTSLGSTAPSMRLGAGSPSHEYGSRLFSKRAREIQAQEGLGPQIWGPPTSGHSTPLRETIPESPNTDSFPDFNATSISDGHVPQPARQRTRAGTLPSRFSPGGNIPGLSAYPTLPPKTSRPTPSTSPFQQGPGTPTETSVFLQNLAPNTKDVNAYLARLRSGSMPQRPNLMTNNPSPFGSALGLNMYTSARNRSSTLHSIQSSNAPTSPAQSHFSRDSMVDNDVKTLDYLGLAETPQQLRPTLAPSDIEMLLEQQRSASANLQNSRFRSYSVNAKEKYADDELEEMEYGGYSGQMTPAAEAMALNEAVRQHNLEVQAFANFASQNRPRARTAGILDTPTRLMRNYLPTSSRLENSMNAGDFSEDVEYTGLAEAVHGMQLGGKPELVGDETNLEGPTRALWLGNIPSSTTVSSLNVIFSNYGSIESTRVLTHKNCGFVNFENLESAIRAKQQLNGKEIFPGAGPVRIGYAKVQSASVTPGNNGVYPSPSPDPQAQGQADNVTSNNGNITVQGQVDRINLDATAAPLTTPKLPDIRDDIIDIVKDLGANDEEQTRIAVAVDTAIQNDEQIKEISPGTEPNHNRIHDAPRLREIRKRIDNQSCSQPEIEEVAMNMLPEIAELSSDYLGNTVVQKLFEYCSESTKEAMLREIAPHLAEIGIHKNGTWAAQKIIDVARTPELMKMVVDSLRNYGVTLFLDQFGNYVMQGCLRYSFPLNQFIFDVMLSRLWELAQGRFGARAMRACLESHYATKDQQRMIAAAIALHSVQLATNANGALLLTWFLDTCTFPRRRTVLAPRLVPHLVHLCTHKVAYLTVLKIINQRNEPEARDTILKALFFSQNDQVLEDILSDQACGATLIFKVLTTPFFDEKIRPDVVQNVRTVLIRIKAQPAQGYKRLMDEVNLSTRGTRDHSAARGAEGSRPGSRQAEHVQAPGGNDANRQFFPGMAQMSYDTNVGLQRTGSMDSNGVDQFQMNGNPMFAQNAMQSTPQQLQYQQAMLAARGGFPHMNGFGATAPTMGNFRVNNGFGAPGMPASMVQPNGGFSQAGYNPMMNPMYQQYQNPYIQQQPQQPIATGRRGRR